MTEAPLNPFRFGNPVQPEYFVGRQQALRSTFSRLRHGDSIAIVGLPGIGKTSLLRYIADQNAQTHYLKESLKQFVFVEIDIRLLSESDHPEDFWQTVLSRMEMKYSQEHIQMQLQIVRRSSFGSFTLKRLFELLAQEKQCLVLLIDGFDKLLKRAHFNSADFFGALRSLSTTTHGLALVTASRMSVTEMNQQTLEINPLGSPFLTHLWKSSCRVYGPSKWIIY